MPRFDAPIPPELKWAGAHLKSLVQAAGGGQAVAEKLSAITGQTVTKQQVSTYCTGRTGMTSRQWRSWIAALNLTSVRELYPPGLPPEEEEKEEK